MNNLIFEANVGFLIFLLYSKIALVELGEVEYWSESISEKWKFKSIYQFHFNFSFYNIIFKFIHFSISFTKILNF